MSLASRLARGRAVDGDRHAHRAGDLDVDDREVRVPHQHAGAQRRRGVSRRCGSRELGAGHAVGDDGGIRLRTPVPGRRMVAPRGTRLTRRTWSFNASVSRYSPGSTTTVDPAAARCKRRARSTRRRPTVMAPARSTAAAPISAAPERAASTAAAAVRRRPRSPPPASAINASANDLARRRASPRRGLVPARPALAANCSPST